MVKPQRRFVRERPATLTGLVLAVLLLCLWHPGDRAGFWGGIEGRLLDARFLLRGPLPPPDTVAILAFDDATMARLGTFPPPRAALAAAVSTAWDAGAALVVLDFLLVDPRADDVALVVALARGDAVLAVAEAASASRAVSVPDPRGFALVTGPAPLAPPLPALAPAPALQAVARLGHATVEHEGDGSLRRMRPSLALATAEGVVVLPGLAIAALAGSPAGGPASLRVPADRVGGQLQIGALAVPLDRRGMVPLNHLGPAGTIPTIPAADADQARLDGRIVFIGATAVGFGDRHASPFDATLPGVEAHATLAANLLAGASLRRDDAAWLFGAALALCAAIAGFAAADLARPMSATAATVGVAVTVAAALQMAFLAGWWLDAATVLLSLALGVAAGAGLRRRDQRRRVANLARYQSPALVETLATLEDPLRNQPPQPVVVLFVDVAGFTTYAEALDPGQANAFLGLFHRLIEQTAEPCGGVIAHFAGDGALVAFGVPTSRPDDNLRALHFIDALYTAVRDCAAWPGLGLRVGGDLGLVQVGIVGGLRHRHLSIGGDVVNTASRLLDVARACDASLALSEALMLGSPAAADWVAKAGLRRATELPLRGRVGVKDVWIGEPFAEASAGQPRAAS